MARTAPTTRKVPEAAAKRARTAAVAASGIGSTNASGTCRTSERMAKPNSSTCSSGIPSSTSSVCQSRRMWYPSLRTKPAKARHPGRRAAARELAVTPPSPAA